MKYDLEVNTFIIGNVNNIKCGSIFKGETKSSLPTTGIRTHALLLNDIKWKKTLTLL